ncbi:MAG: hypothetical protein GY906_12855 [bacterium]|nr:hypothetical protein [bacterium]
MDRFHALMFALGMLVGCVLTVAVLPGTSEPAVQVPQETTPALSIGEGNEVAITVYQGSEESDLEARVTTLEEWREGMRKALDGWHDHRTGPAEESKSDE